FNKLKNEFNLTYVFISHDLSVVKHVSDRVAVMYLGEIVEISPTKEMYDDPKHPYTKALMASIPHPDPNKRKELELMHGEVPSPIHPPSGCRFHPRCKFAMKECFDTEPENYDLGNGHLVKCHLYKNINKQ